MGVIGGERRGIGVLATIVALTLAFGCGDSRTEIIVAVDTDMAVPEQVDNLQVEVSGPEMEMERSRADLGANEPPLPRTLGLVHRGGPLGPLDIRAVGRLGDTDVVEQAARVSFQRGRTLMLPMHLREVCAPGCPSLDDDDLVPWQGEPSAIDGGMSSGQDAGGGGDAGSDCTPSDEECNEIDDDCDGTVDEDFDLQNDSDNCGTCGNECTFPHGSGECESSNCTVTSCEAPWADCDGDGGNGCETNTDTDAAHCGECDNPCTPPRCSGGECVAPGG